MLYSGERPPRPRMPFVTSGLQLRSYENLQVYPVDVITVDRFPPRAEHPLLKQPVKSAANSVGMIGGGDDRMKRIMREVNPHELRLAPESLMNFRSSDQGCRCRPAPQHRPVLQRPRYVISQNHFGSAFFAFYFGPRVLTV
jgi:hypothetical protein